MGSPQDQTIQTYEAIELLPDESLGGGVTLEVSSDQEAIAIAAQYAQRWSARVQLYRTPALNMSSTSSFDRWPGQLKLISELAPE